MVFFLTVKVSNPDSWTRVHADQEYLMCVNVLRPTRRVGRSDKKAITPRFPKQKDEGWFLVLGSSESKELMAMKRVSYISGRSNQQLVFYTPRIPGRYIYRLYCLSDCYQGLDQQYDLHLDVTEASISAQVNSEVTEGKEKEVNE